MLVFFVFFLLVFCNRTLDISLVLTLIAPFYIKSYLQFWFGLFLLLFVYRISLEQGDLHLDSQFFLFFNKHKMKSVINMPKNLLSVRLHDLHNQTLLEVMKQCFSSVFVLILFFLKTMHHILTVAICFYSFFILHFVFYS